MQNDGCRYAEANPARAIQEAPAVIAIAVYIGAALAEIAGCFAFWAWPRLGYSVWWLFPGMITLALFAYLLTLADKSAV